MIHRSAEVWFEPGQFGTIKELFRYHLSDEEYAALEQAYRAARQPKR
jgi:hypothetical protein